MRKLFVVVLVAISLLFPTRAEAIPVKFRNCPQVKRDGITYLLYKDAAIVRRTPNRRTVTIPYAIRVKGKRFVIRAIWDGALKGRKIRRIDLHAYLETCEDDTLFVRDARNVRIIVHRRSDFKWLKQGEPCCNSLVSLKK